MTQFKSFTPQKFSKAHRYLRWPKGDILKGDILSMLCCNCGYPYGQHFGNNRCPNRDEVAKGIKAVKHIKPS